MQRTLSPRKNLIVFALVGGLSSLVHSAPAGLEFLEKGPVKLVVPFAAGGGVDTAARLLAKQLQEDVGVPFMVENRPGGNGVIGGKAVQTAPPNGHTLLFSAATHVLAKLVMAQPPYDPVADFTPIARVAEAPLLMVISPNLPQSKLSDVIQAVKQRPDQWTAALPGLGAPSHIGTLLLAKQGPTQLTTAVYKGTAPALADIAGGHSQILVDSIISMMPLVKAGKVKALAVTSSKRSSIAPDIPTAVEAGYPGLVHTSWYGVWAPKSMTESKVQALNKAINTAVKELAGSSAFSNLGIEPVIETPSQFQKFVAADVAKSADLLKSSGYQPQ